ncbi:MAG: hypothetical protein M3022_11135 [Actinomycetota bacterium]|nr:hypothetical protein [Actinomycetota bacterium]
MTTLNRYRPVIWLAMLGVALLLLVSPALIGFLVLGMSAGILFRLRLRAPRQPLRPPTRGDRKDRRRIRRS